MKKGIHPENYRLVAFKDMSNNDVFITKSAVETKDSISVDGIDYPLVKLEISRTSHPYYTGKTKLVDTAGRIDKFKNRYANVSLKSKQSPLEDAPAEEQKRLQLQRKLQQKRLQLQKKILRMIVTRKKNNFYNFFTTLFKFS